MNKGLKPYGVVVPHQNGVTVLKGFSDEKPDRNAVLVLLWTRYETELKQRHLPVHGWCRNKNKERIRLKFLREYKSAVANIERGNYLVKVLQKI